MTEEQEREALIEATTTAWRPRTIDGSVRAHPAWHDLDEAGRVEAHESTRRLRALEAHLDPAGLTSTAKAVLARIRGT
jgi:hypothetical protein